MQQFGVITLGLNVNGIINSLNFFLSLRNLIFPFEQLNNEFPDAVRTIYLPMRIARTAMEFHVRFWTERNMIDAFG